MASDMWSAGVVLHICVAGTFPFRDAKNANTFLENVTLACKKKEFSGISPSLRTIVEGLLVADPSVRLTARDSSKLASKEIEVVRRSVAKITFAENLTGEVDEDDDGFDTAKLPLISRRIAENSPHPRGKTAARDSFSSGAA